VKSKTSILLTLVLLSALPALAESREPASVSNDSDLVMLGLLAFTLAGLGLALLRKRLQQDYFFLKPEYDLEYINIMPTVHRQGIHLSNESRKQSRKGPKQLGAI
jgi:hypothetical protein